MFLLFRYLNGPCAPGQKDSERLRHKKPKKIELGFLTKDKKENCPHPPAVGILMCICLEMSGIWLKSNKEANGFIR